MSAEVSAQLLLFVEQTRDFVGVADGWGHVLYLNPAAAKRLGIVDPSGLTLADVFPSEETAFYYDEVRPELLRAGAWSGEVRVNIAGEGAVKMSVSTTATIGPGGAIDGLVVHARELPRAATRDVDDEGELDDATGLLARSAFEARLRRALLAQRRGGDSCGLVLVDISGVNELTDAVGRSRATIMRSLAGRLRQLARAFDVAGRVDEHHLALLLGAVRDHGEVARIALGVCESLAAVPVPTAGGDIAVAVRCGAAVGKSGDEPVDVIARAAAAMSLQPALQDADVEPPRAVVERSAESPNLDELRVAFSHHGVRPYAQRVVDLRSGHTIGYRGTARWHHFTLGVLDAADFLKMVASTTLASQLDLCVARELAEVLTLSTIDTPLRLYTPVSKQLIADVRTAQYLTEIADALHLSTDQMRLQVARGLLDDWAPSLQEALESLREAGFGFVLTGVDDVSDMSAVIESFDELHLSRRLTQAVATDADARRSASALIRVAHERAVVVGATGVDTELIRDVLVDSGCELGSGELFGAAEPACDID